MNIQGINEGKIKIDIVEDSSGVTVKFAGDIDMADPSTLLDPFFESVHKEVLSNSVKIVFLDFKDLTFLNSSGIKAIAKWIMKLATLGENEKYKISIKQNKEITWQTTSLPTLAFLVPGAVEVD